MQRSMLVVVLGALMALPILPAAAFERTEEREACWNHDPLRRPLFGDLHVHTRYSFDSYTSGQRNGPRGAYRYAKGETIELPGAEDGEVIRARIRRPLDFTSVTDHAEFLGEIALCTGEPGTLGYWTPLCMLTRSDSFMLQLVAAGQWSGNVAQDVEKRRAYPCRWSDESCQAALVRTWQDLQAAAEEHYDRSAACGFTTFVGYEYTDTPGMRNLHRNVIYRNERVTEIPISSYETGPQNFPKLWRLLRSECIEGVPGCDVLSIPHNSNLSGGLMFPDPENEEQARDRLFFEPIVELIQHKAASECRFDRLAGRGVDTADELCSFEQNKTDNLASLGVFQGEMQTERGAPVGIDDFARRNMVRNALKDGLALERESGLNPFKLGFIGSTDTHSAVPGGAMESDYVGHLGRRDAGWRNVQDHIEDNPGGLAVVWAEENSRDAIFESMRRRETYATSGTRPVVRFFAGSELPLNLCARDDFAATGYAQGVPMGGELRDLDPAHPPRFAVSAMKDPGTGQHPGTDLERVQIVKGWIDAEGATHERVYDVAGSERGADVDPEHCAPRGPGDAALCAVWTDPEFDASQAAFYYVRVLENPTCRWSTLQCMAVGVNPFAASCSQQAARASEAASERGASGEAYTNCCLAEAEEPFYSPLVQERAWTSPIWFHPSPGT